MPFTQGKADRRLRQMTWRTSCALGLIATFGSLFLLGSLCLATDVFHAATPHDHHHDHPETGPNTTLIDLCDFVLWTLSTVDLVTGRFPSSVALVSDGFALALAYIPDLRVATSYPIRAPPVSPA